MSKKSSSDDYEVEYIIDIKKYKPKNKTLPPIAILIKWVGYEMNDSTWEPIDNLNPEAAIELIEELK